jgi:hypothetical protein
MINGRCRLHGGLSTGPKTESGLFRIQQALTKHGRYSKQEIENRRMIRSLMRDARGLLREISSQSRREHVVGHADRQHW